MCHIVYMKLKCRQYGNSWIVTIPKEMNHPEFVYIYLDEQVSDSERLKRMEKSLNAKL